MRKDIDNTRKDIDNTMLFKRSKKDAGLSLNNKKVNRTANVLVIGGTGTGKTFKYIKPTILQTSDMVLTDLNGFTSNLTNSSCTSKKWRIILSDVAKTFRRIHPELSENNAIETAKRFMESEKVASYCVGRWIGRGSSMAVRRMKKKYGDEPFRFGKDGTIQAVNKFVLSKWIQEDMKERN